MGNSKYLRDQDLVQNRNDVILEYLKEIRSQLVTHNLFVKEYLNFVEACEYLGLSESTLRKICHRKEIPYSKPNNKLIWFKRSDLDEYIKKGFIKSESDLDVEVQLRSSTLKIRKGGCRG